MNIILANISRSPLGYKLVHLVAIVCYFSRKLWFMHKEDIKRVWNVKEIQKTMSLTSLLLVPSQVFQTKLLVRWTSPSLAVLKAESTWNALEKVKQKYNEREKCYLLRLYNCQSWHWNSIFRSQRFIEIQLITDCHCYIIPGCMTIYIKLWKKMLRLLQPLLQFIYKFKWESKWMSICMKTYNYIQEIWTEETVSHFKTRAAESSYLTCQAW